MRTPKRSARRRRAGVVRKHSRCRCAAFSERPRNRLRWPSSPPRGHIHLPFIPAPGQLPRQSLPNRRRRQHQPRANRPAPSPRSCVRSFRSSAQADRIAAPERSGLMKHLWKVALVASLMASPAAAQGQQAPSDPLAAALKRQFDGVSRNVKEAAEKMPEDKFSYQAAKDVRTFGGLVGHVANAQFNACARAKGVDNPNKQDFEKVTGKSALVKAITDANDFCSGILAGASDKWLLETLPQ